MVTEIRGLLCACELVSGNCETSIRYYSAAEPNFLFDVVRREQWRLWSKRCKHLFASRSLPARLNWNVSEESVFLHPPHSAQHMCACIEHRRGAGEAFFCSSLLTTHQGTGCGELFFRSFFPLFHLWLVYVFNRNCRLASKVLRRWLTKEAIFARLPQLCQVKNV